MPYNMPLKASNFKVYLGGEDLLGIAEGNFPNIEFMSSEISGAGLAGTIDMPTPGHFGSLTCSLTWRTITEHFTRLSAPYAHELDLYAEHLGWNSGLGSYTSHSIHAYMKAMTKRFDLGKLVVGDSAEAQTEHEIFYFKLSIDNTEQILIDKANYIYRVNGLDYLTDTRRALGKM